MKRFILFTTAGMLFFLSIKKWPLKTHQLEPVSKRVSSLPIPCKTPHTDIDSNIHYFYHRHRAGENGHFHIFFIDEDQSVTHHLVGLSIDDEGQLIQIFTTAPWVTQEEVLPHKELIKRLQSFRFSERTLTNEWMESVFLAYAFEIQDLLTIRDIYHKPKFGRYDIVSAMQITKD